MFWMFIGGFGIGGSIMRLLLSWRFYKKTKGVMLGTYIGMNGGKDHYESSEFIDNVCLSYRHDFGLLSEEEKKKVRFECEEWFRAIRNNERSRG